MTDRKSTMMGEGPYHQDPEQEEVAGFFDGIAHGRSIVLRSVRTHLAPLGLTISRRASLVAISEAEPIPESVGKRPDNPFENPHYDLGYRCGTVAARHLYLPALNTLLLPLEMSLADNGTVSSSPRTARLAADFVASGRELTAPPVLSSPNSAAFLALFTDRKARTEFLRGSPSLPAPARTISRRALLSGVCASLLLAAGLGWWTLGGGSGKSFAPERTQLATVLPVEAWIIFEPEEIPTLQAIDQWIVDRYNQGNYLEIVNVMTDLMSSVGNNPIKDLASYYVYGSKRWELARFLLPAVDPSKSDSNARYNALAAIRDALEFTGIQFFSSADRAFMQNYVQSGSETASYCVTTAQIVLSRMVQQGL